MNVLVIGCGHVGSKLASILSRMGHDTSVIDVDDKNFDYLDNDFTGFTVKGIPIDQDILRHAGIEGCDALAAVTSDDNINAMVCQIAKEVFKVPRVIARIYNPLKEIVFSNYHIKTICSTTLTVSSVYSMLTDIDQTKHLSFDDSIVSFKTKQAPTKWVDKSCEQVLQEMSSQGGQALFAILHSDGKMTFMNHNDYIIKSDDRIIVSEVID
ncbi:MAG: TrkA family potassium uptake protein [Oscillospiraceae bacterium]